MGVSLQLLDTHAVGRQVRWRALLRLNGDLADGRAHQWAGLGRCAGAQVQCRRRQSGSVLPAHRWVDYYSGYAGAGT
jgi:hypothetical protein